MIKSWTILLIYLLISFVSEGQRKTVFIIVDGIPPDVVKKVETPNLDEIAGKNGFTDAHVGGVKGSYSESTTVSAVGYNHVLTGVWSNKHNVYDNDIKSPNYNYWNVFRIVKAQNTKARTAIFSSWLDNRTKLIGESLPEAGSFKFDYSFDGLELDTIRFPHTGENYMHPVDERVSEEAASYILREGPDLSWVYLQFTDDMGHAYGDNPKFYDAVRKADNQVGRIWKSVKERMKNSGEEWMILVTTDHGRDNVSGKNHGGQSERERSAWIVTNGEPLNAYFKQNPGTIDVAPSILRFMKIPVPETVQNEFDGVPFIGEVSLCDASAKRNGDKCTVTWKPLSTSGTAEVLVATTNRFAVGETDNYQSMGKANVAVGSYTFNLKPEMKTGFLKILIKAPNNTVNTWIVPGDEIKKQATHGE